MANINPLMSKSMSIVIDGSVLGCATDFSLSVNKDMIEIACLSSTGAKQQIPDLYGWSISFSGLRIKTANVESGKLSYDDLLSSLLTSDTDVSVWILPDVSSNKYEVGNAYISSMTMDGGVGSAVTFSGELSGNGALSILTTA